jgi:heat shock protein HslJ
MQTARALAAVASAVAIALLLASCAPTRDEGGPDPVLRGQWQLQKATDADGEIPLANQLITLTIDKDATTAGRSTCSSYRAHVYGSASALWVTASIPQPQHCGIEAQHDLEHRYIEALGRVHTATVSGGVLHLLAPGIDLQFERALALPLTYLVGHTWRLTAIRADSYYSAADPESVSIGGATLRFGGDGELTGRTGCHTFTGHYLENAGEIVVHHLRERAAGGCRGKSPTADASVLQVIAAGVTFVSESGALSISSPSAQLTLDFVD